MPALKNFLPQSEQGHVIFTTRSRQLANRLAPSHIITIPEMDEETAQEFLRRSLIQKVLLDGGVTSIALLRQLSLFSLAITQAAAYINERGITLVDYLSLLQAQEEDVVELLSENFEDDRRYAEIQNPVATTWLITFHYIQQANWVAADYLAFMACASPRDIPRSLLPPVKSLK
jgi:riboflavin biosynthesis pyrimidine reductase